jgi:hypothetical protein
VDAEYHDPDPADQRLFVCTDDLRATTTVMPIDRSKLDTRHSVTVTIRPSDDAPVKYPPVDVVAMVRS